MNDDPQPIYDRPFWLTLGKDSAARAAWNEMVFYTRTNKEMLDRAAELFREEIASKERNET